MVGALHWSETVEDKDQKTLEDIVKGHKDAKGTHVLEQKTTDFYNEIKIYKRDKKELEIQMEQLVFDYERLKEESHDISYKLEKSQLQKQLKTSYECSSSLMIVTEKIATKTMTEVNELIMQKRQEMLKNKCSLILQEKNLRAELEKMKNLILQEKNLRTELEKMKKFSFLLYHHFQTQKESRSDVRVRKDVTFSKSSVRTVSIEDRECSTLDRSLTNANTRLQRFCEAGNLQGAVKLLRVSGKWDIDPRTLCSVLQFCAYTRSLKDEKEAEIAELRTVRTQCNDENDLEIKRHKKQVVQVKGELKKKEEEIANLVKKLKAAEDVRKLVAVESPVTKTAKKRRNRR